MIKYNTIMQKSKEFQKGFRISVQAEYASHNGKMCIVSARFAQFMYRHGLCDKGDIITTDDLLELLNIL